MIRDFGNLSDGRSVKSIRLGSVDGLQAEILSYGAILRRLSVPTRQGRRELVVTLPSLASYELDRAYVGQLLGRCSNRIAGAAFTLQGRQCRLSANDGVNQLHGGAGGFGRCLWEVIEAAGSKSVATRVVLGLHSRAGDQGYPGNLQVRAEFTAGASELELNLESHCDEATPLSLTYHPYFNLAGVSGYPVADMQLRIASSGYLPVRDSQLIPEGTIAPVADSPFDFRMPRSVQAPAVSTHAQLAHGAGYDHCWVLDPAREWDAELHSQHSGIGLQLRSDSPALQFYDGHGLGRDNPGVSGICLEPQQYPNAVNEPGFPRAILQPGQTFRTRIVYRFQDAG